MTNIKTNYAISKLNYLSDAFENAYDNFNDLLDGIFIMTMAAAAEKFYRSGIGNYTISKLPPEEKRKYTIYAGLKFYSSNEYYLIDSDELPFAVVYSVDYRGIVRDKIFYTDVNDVCDVYEQFNFSQSKGVC